jgi:hypothetical protein
MMALGRGWPDWRGYQQPQYAAPQTPVMVEVMQLRPPAMPTLGQAPATFAGGLAEGLRQVMAQRQQIGDYQEAGRRLLKRLFGVDPSIGSSVQAPSQTLTPPVVGDAPIGGLY